MRNNTQRIYELLSKGDFLCYDSNVREKRDFYRDLEENKSEYAEYFSELGLTLEEGEGYFCLCRTKEIKGGIENKIEALFKWVHIMSFLKTYNVVFSAGFLFRKSEILESINIDIELRDKARRLYPKLTNQDIAKSLISDMVKFGCCELINELDDTYRMTSAFNYLERLVEILTMFNEENIPET